MSGTLFKRELELLPSSKCKARIFLYGSDVSFCGIQVCKMSLQLFLSHTNFLNFVYMDILLVGSISS